MTLPFNIQKQSALDLCWAAVASSVSKFYNANSEYEQCKIANLVLNTTECCIDLNKCNKQESLRSALKVTGNLSGNVIQGKPSFEFIKNEIINRRVVCVRIYWRETENEGHFVVIHGFYDNLDVDVQDPWPTKNPGRIAFTELELFYQDLGEITHFYKTKPEIEI